jgi:hypothetical protein
LGEKLKFTKLKKNSVMPFFFGKCENVIFFGKIVLALQNVFIFCVMKVFSGAIQHAKFEHRSPDKIKRYTALFF